MSHRSFEGLPPVTSLPPRAEVAVIGGGVVGLCAAYELAAHGRQVVVIDQGPIARGSAAGNAGLITPSHLIPMAAPGVLSGVVRGTIRRTGPVTVRPSIDAASVLSPSGNPVTRPCTRPSAWGAKAAVTSCAPSPCSRDTASADGSAPSGNVTATRASPPDSRSARFDSVVISNTPSPLEPTHAAVAVATAVSTNTRTLITSLLVPTRPRRCSSV